MEHSALVDRADQAISAVFSDRSVEQWVTKDSLEQLKEAIIDFLNALNNNEGDSRD